MANELRLASSTQPLLDAVTARRRAYFARRDAEASRPQEILLEVAPEHISGARAQVAAIWAEASRYYEAWDFPTHPGVLCDWCPFADRCEGYAELVASRAAASTAA